MKAKTNIFIILLIAITCIYGNNAIAQGTGYTNYSEAGTIIINKAIAEYYLNNNKIGVTNIVFTPVMAIYGASIDVQSDPADTLKGGTNIFTYSVTNKGNIDIDLVIKLSNFVLSSSNPTNDIDQWEAWVSLDPAKKIIGTTPQNQLITTSIQAGFVETFYLMIKTSPNSSLSEAADIPIQISIANLTPYTKVDYTNWVTNNPNYYTNYFTTNNTAFLVVSQPYSGATNLYFGFPTTNYLDTNAQIANIPNQVYTIIKEPLIILTKSVFITNHPAYLADGGSSTVPVPQAIITYSNWYSNAGNANAVGLIIIDNYSPEVEFVDVNNDLKIDWADIDITNINGPIQTTAANFDITTRQIKLIFVTPVVPKQSGYITYKVTLYRHPKP